VAAFRVKLGANDLNCVDMPLSHSHSLTFGVCLLDYSKSSERILMKFLEGSG